VDLPEHARVNRDAWDREAVQYVEPARRSWSAAEISWGIWDVPEADVGILPPVAGLDVIELGCGTGYISAWMARRRARPVGLDNSPNQLATAARLQREHHLSFPLLLGSAEEVPLPDASFDFAISEYGAVLWADPERWVPEAARLLRPGGRLHVLTNHLLVVLTAPDDPDAPVVEQLLRPQFGTPRAISWEGETSVEFHLPHSDWISLFTRTGFEILELQEVQAPEGGTTSYGWMPYEWARKWPYEETWKVRKRT
jgi:SAM-dependent methyltransferase